MPLLLPFLVAKFPRLLAQQLKSQKYICVISNARVIQSDIKNINFLSLQTNH